MSYHAYSIVFLFISTQGTISSSEQQLAKVFEDDFIVPHLLPIAPPELSPIIYKPGLIILTGKPYFPYQIQELPDITWNYKDETYYTIVILGAFQRQGENTTPKDSRNSDKITVSPPEQWWHQWVKVNVFENCIDSTGTDLKRFSQSEMLQPNSTHRVLQVFAIYQQKEKIELNLEVDPPNKLLQQHFTPLSNFENNFPGTVLLSGNFFHMIEKFELKSGIREDLFDPKALKLKKTVESAQRANNRYFGL
ncbi:putative odorant-binding protein A5 [Planococcus citri]|uniref:putative odorant-binding protein A5 n=1 Tax=Planococcus citri TaxID=170843 RepID=UPI0031F99F3C